MAKLPILRFPDTRLRQKAKPVEQFDATLEQFSLDMIETMYDSEGIGLAAVQVNDLRRLIVVDVSEQQDTPMVFVNPEIVEKSGETVSKEGCLSVPQYFEEVKRAEWVRLRYQDVQGVTHEVEAEGLFAICIQHEIDHLNGRLFVDYLSDLKRERALKLMRKQAKFEAAEATA